MKTKHRSSSAYQAGVILALLAVACWDSHAAPRPTASIRAVVKTDADDGLESANTEFAFNLLNELTTEDPGTNIIISPYSASTALQMAASGAAGLTSTQMQDTLGTADMAPLDLYRANKELDELLNNGDTNIVLTAANSLWYLKGFPIEQGFLMNNADYFGARIAGLDFGLQSSVDTINAWASDETHGKIDKIVNYPLPPGLVLLLANAVYFHGNWQNAFDSSQTSNQPFYLSDGTQESVPTMQQATNFDYYATDNYQAVRLPYQGSNVAMYVFLPAPGVTLPDLMKTMSAAWWQQSVGTFFTQRTGTLALPKFSLQCNLDLNQPLQNLGIQLAFTPEANFSKISRSPLQISDVKQQAVIDVDEQGTVATAVTTITVVTTVAGPDLPFQMTVNRPFMFVIEDRKAATILFMGAVFAP